ncbi:MAG: hypothetical protein GYB25_12560 [Rhodobacteraceae bacterium]|nr:hypothetical protein [Paracoccaceae bacterium]
MPLEMTAPCRTLVDRVQRRARWARWRAHLRPRAERQRFIYDNTFRNDIEAVAFFLARETGEIPNFAVPTTYSEKMRGQFLTHPNPLMSIAADKIAMRAYCDRFDLPIRPVPLIATFDTPEDLDPRDLPESCILKITDGCKMNLLHTPETPVARKRYNRFLRDKWHIDHWRRHAELHYRDIPKRILVEEALLPDDTIEDIGVYCAMGKPYLLYALPKKMAALEDRLAPLEAQGGRQPTPLSQLASAPEVDAILETARKLSAPLLHCRVDFMRHAGRLHLGEITLSPGGYYSPLTPVHLEKMRGDLFDLARLPDLLSQGRQIASDLGLPTETSFGHYGDDPRLATGGQ